LYGSENWSVGEREARRITAAEMEIYEKNSTIHLERLQNKYRDFKGIKYNFRFVQNLGLQKQLDATCKQNAS
jgi:hypothetical protein